MRLTRLATVLASLACFFGFAAAASAQTRTVTIHLNYVNTGGEVRVLSGGASPIAECLPGGSNPCRVLVNQGATIEIAAAYPGRLSAGIGPAAACALSTCTFTMTGDADVTATFTLNDGPFATLTTTLAGDGTGTLWADGAPCLSGSCAVKYLVGSSVRLTAAGVGTARFTGYSSASGDASACGTSASCTLVANSDSSVTGTFVALTSFSVAPSSAMGVPGGAPQTFTVTGTYSSGPTAAIASAPGAWSVAPALPSGRLDAAAAALGGKVYAVGGGQGLGASSTLFEFDPDTQTWTSRASMATPRAFDAAAVAGGQLYAMGGWNGTLPATTAVASMERYDPATDTWTMRAPMGAARRGMVTGTINGIIYAAGGSDFDGNPVGTLEAYDPATDTWTQKPGMFPRRNAVGGVVDGILYVAGGVGEVGVGGVMGVTADVQAYDPATNTWTLRAPLPIPLAGAAAAVADGVLYVMTGTLYQQSVVYAYDPASDAWSVKTPMATPVTHFTATSLNGIVYAIGGQGTGVFGTGADPAQVETFVDGLRWSSSAPAVARIAQTGAAMPLTAGTTTIVANVGGTTCDGSCPTFTVVGPTDMSLDAPADHSSAVAGSTLTIGGWALNRAASSGTGVDAVHVYAVPNGGAAIFLGVATYGIARSDIGALFGAQFTNSGFELKAGSTLAAGAYTILVYAHNALTHQFDAAKSASVTLTAPVSIGQINIDAPASGAVVTSAFEIGGWAIDHGAPTGSGVDAVQFYVQPAGSPAPGVFVGTGSYGASRPDVGAAFGAQFTNSGFHFTITGLGPGSYTLAVYARSTVTGSFSIVTTLPFSVNANQLMSIDLPSPEATIGQPVLGIAGWSIDRTAAGPSDTGVDALHVYAYPNPGSGTPPIFLGVATYGIARSDVGAAYGSKYTNSGYQLTVNTVTAGLGAGVYSIAVISHSTSGAFNNLAVVRVTIQ